MLDEREFRARSEEAIDSLNRTLGQAAETYDFEVDMNAGALTVELEEPPAKFVVSPNAPVRQIWVSAHSKSFKLDWNSAKNAFELATTGETLEQLIAARVSEHLGETVEL
ncbi:MAG: iron donor protein CyaY [Bryobacteraceae bacterium]|nr:iron donor protein CyaY [Bryobacteraceae bacterium]